MLSNVSDEIITTLGGRIEEYQASFVTPTLEMIAIRNAMSFLACNAYRRSTQKRLRIDHIINNLIYCEDSKGEPIDSEAISQINAIIESQISEKYISIVTIPKENAVKWFTKKGHLDTVEIIKSLGKTEITCACLGQYIQPIYGPIEVDLSKIKKYQLHPVTNGFMIELPGLFNLKDGKLNEWRQVPNQHYKILDIEKYFKSINCHSISQLNSFVTHHKISELDVIKENYHKAQMSSIFRKILEHPEKRIISIAGSSSSGKSTFAYVLLQYLTDNGLPATILSMDDYFVNRVDTPLDEDGKYDFESVYTLQLHLLSDRINALLDGEDIPARNFDFKTGIGSDLPRKISLPKNGYIILEGIHGLNPILLDIIGKDLITKIYVAPMMPLSIDSENCFDPDDLLLIRRVIRDFSDRGFSARTNIAWWPDVCKGTWKNIIPNINEADVFYDSSLVYELSKASKSGIDIFSTADKLLDQEVDNQFSREVTQEGNRMMHMLQLFKPLD